MAAPAPPFAARYAALYPPELRDRPPSETAWWESEGAATRRLLDGLAA